MATELDAIKLPIISAAIWSFDGVYQPQTSDGYIASVIQPRNNKTECIGLLPSLMVMWCHLWCIQLSWITLHLKCHSCQTQSGLHLTMHRANGLYSTNPHTRNLRVIQGVRVPPPTFWAYDRKNNSDWSLMFASISGQMALVSSFSSHFGPNLQLLFKLHWLSRK